MRNTGRCQRPRIAAMSTPQTQAVDPPGWQALAAGYDGLLPRILPGAEAFFGCCTSFVPPGRVAVLELGSGTGYATEALLKRNPQAQVTCLDLSSEMLAVAAAKPGLQSVQFLQQDIRDAWPSNPFDVVFTTLCLHHLTDRERSALVRRAFGALPSGGCFINGDVFQPREEWEERLACQRWCHHMSAQGMTPEETAAMLAKRRANQSCLDTFSGWRSKLRQAGFARIFSPLTIEFYAVFAAFKSSVADAA